MKKILIGTILTGILASSLSASFLKNDNQIVNENQLMKMKIGSIYGKTGIEDGNDSILYSFSDKDGLEANIRYGFNGDLLGSVGLTERHTVNENLEIFVYTNLQTFKTEIEDQDKRFTDLTTGFGIQTFTSPVSVRVSVGGGLNDIKLEKQLTIGIPIKSNFAVEITADQKMVENGKDTEDVNSIKGGVNFRF
jgi:hypothetical protein